MDLSRLRAGARLARLAAGIVIGAVLLADGASAQVRLSELLAANRTTSSDEDGDTSDWLELVNDGAEPVDLGGWAISDDPQHVRKS